MWKCRARERGNRFQILLLIAGVSLLGAGCRRDMQDQPKIKPFRGSSFFTDGTGGRQPIDGTIARGFLRNDVEYFTGKKATATASASPSASSSAQS
ncbi:MAG TPA: hypothetical protein VFZ22_17070, partial [Pyrinomonadaceae bacterium]|nr:hypothetical protein [Pyrinomonadaceae bacterium]